MQAHACGDGGGGGGGRRGGGNGGGRGGGDGGGAEGFEERSPRGAAKHPEKCQVFVQGAVASCWLKKLVLQPDAV